MVPLCEPGSLITKRCMWQSWARIGRGVFYRNSITIHVFPSVGYYNPCISVGGSALQVDVANQQHKINRVQFKPTTPTWGGCPGQVFSCFCVLVVRSTHRGGSVPRVYTERSDIPCFLGVTLNLIPCNEAVLYRGRGHGIHITLKPYSPHTGKKSQKKT